MKSQLTSTFQETSKKAQTETGFQIYLGAINETDSVPYVTVSEFYYIIHFHNSGSMRLVI